MVFMTTNVHDLNQQKHVKNSSNSFNQTLFAIRTSHFTVRMVNHSALKIVLDRIANPFNKSSTGKKSKDSGVSNMFWMKS